MERKVLLLGETGVLGLVVHPVLWKNGFQLHLQFQVILLGDSLLLRDLWWQGDYSTSFFSYLFNYFPLQSGPEIS